MANLLIVDDNAGLREGVRTFLDGKGHATWTAGGVDEAMEAVHKHKPDLVLSDLRMDDGTGLVLRDRIRGMGLERDPYFILFTAYPDQDNAREAYQHGVDLYLTKPFQLSALAMAVDNGLRQCGALALEQRPTEAFCQDLVLTLNPVLPRLLMLLGGRYGALGPRQADCVANLLGVWRRLVWGMADLQARPQEAAPAKLMRLRWHGPAALTRILEGLAPDLAAAGVGTRILRDPKLPLPLVHPQTAEAILEASVLHLAAFSGPGAEISLHWKSVEGGVALTLQSDLENAGLPMELRRNAALLPALPALLKEAGVEVQVGPDTGPWTLLFHRAA